jgi:hypothetical protein
MRLAVGLQPIHFSSGVSFRLFKTLSVGYLQISEFLDPG